MSIKTAIVILALLLVVLFTVFLYFYISQPAEPIPAEPEADIKIDDQPATKDQPDISTTTIDKEALLLEEKRQEEIQIKIEEIKQEGRNEDGGLTREARQEIDNIINTEIKKQLQERTPEQIEEEARLRRERAKRDKEVNKLIKEQLNSQ